MDYALYIVDNIIIDKLTDIDDNILYA